jgi:hypothetical protein
VSLRKLPFFIFSLRCGNFFSREKEEKKREKMKEREGGGDKIVPDGIPCSFYPYFCAGYRTLFGDFVANG